MTEHSSLYAPLAALPAQGQATQGLILFAHGSRDPAWAAPFEAMLARVRLAQPSLPCTLAYLELMTPTFAQASADLVALGVSHIRVLPVFLAQGKHLRIDLPEFVTRATALHAGLRFTVLGAVGETAALQDAVVALALQTPA